MKFRTEVSIDPTSLRLFPSSRVLLIGSCFAEEVGSRLSDSLGDGQVTVNPCGVLYNPASIAQCLTLLMHDVDNRRQMIDDSLFLSGDGRWHSWLYSTKYVAETREECLQLCMSALQGDLLGGADLLVITLGTDHAYQLRDDGRVVANCHKEPAARFDEILLDSSNALRDALMALHRYNPTLQVILTVSPYRYAKYGYHQSQLSKARLLLQAEALCQEMTTVTYFPAYEIVLDELRDYRFYAADMLHPSAQAADYIFERFRDWCFSPQLVSSAAERQKQLRQQRHISHVTAVAQHDK